MHLQQQQQQPVTDRVLGSSSVQHNCCQVKCVWQNKLIKRMLCNQSNTKSCVCATGVRPTGEQHCLPRYNMNGMHSMESIDRGLSMLSEKHTAAVIPPHIGTLTAQLTQKPAATNRYVSMSMAPLSQLLLPS